MTIPRRTLARRALPAAALVLVGLAALLTLRPSDPPAPLLAAPDSEVVSFDRERAPLRREAGGLREESQQAHSDADQPVTATGSLPPERDLEAEAETAAANRAALIASNIASLEAAAEQALADGNPQRAELMYQRIALLEERAERDL